ncbi:MAG: endolytic transglycosylase MltG [Pararhodobacter sp.]|nr:endolytic transglycosylase MltG [Pararhodobacter sp.]
MMKHVAANALTLLIVGLLMLGALLGIGQRAFVGPGPLEQAICLRVEPGANLRTVARSLEEQGAIASGMIFRVGAQQTDRAGRLRFGSYLIEPGTSMDDILDIVTRGGASTCGTEVLLRIGVTRVAYLLRELDPATNRLEERFNLTQDTDPLPEEFLAYASQPDTRLRVTIAEGVTSWQVWDALRRAEFLSGELPDVPPEGSLAPDSYEIRRGQDRAALIAEIQARQSAILSAAWENRQEGLPLQSPEEALILASIIEKEAGGPRELAAVSSVFYNRMAQRMRFQMDATIIYGITRGEGQFGRPITRSDINGVTEQRRHGAIRYNTYQIDGLPPGPIGNPGRAAIEAALNPDQTPYLYFVADGTGGHAFAATLAEHNRNVARWREVEAEMRRQQAQ